MHVLMIQNALGLKAFTFQHKNTLTLKASLLYLSNFSTHIHHTHTYSVSNIIQSIPVD